MLISPAALWIAASSWQACGATRIIGILFAVSLGCYSFVAQVLPPVVLTPTIILLPLWLAFVRLRIMQGGSDMSTAAAR